MRSNTESLLVPERVRELVHRFERQRILVVGDLMLDRFIYGHVSRISPEAPVPVVKVLRETDMPGGASNVARNIQSLGGRSIVCGFMGEDAHGQCLVDLLEGCGADVSGVVRLADTPTTVKTRIIAEHQQVVRVDWDGPGCHDAAAVAALSKRLDRLLKESTGALIEDYGKGVVTQAVVDQVVSETSRLGIPSGLDPKDNHELGIQGITVATPNRGEAYCAMNMKDTGAHPDPMTDEPLLRVATGLQARWRPELLMITLGAQGVLLAEQDGTLRHMPTRAREVFDVSGAGDTVIAVCLLALAAGATHGEAAELANYAAGVVVGKLGTATCSADDLIACFEP